jgi:hypothetical protein
LPWFSFFIISIDFITEARSISKCNLTNCNQSEDTYVLALIIWETQFTWLSINSFPLWISSAIDGTLDLTVLTTTSTRTWHALPTRAHTHTQKCVCASKTQNKIFKIKSFSRSWDWLASRLLIASGISINWKNLTFRGIFFFFFYFLL